MIHFIGEIEILYLRRFELLRNFFLCFQPKFQYFSIDIQNIETLVLF
jgi:hypothetical protein